MLSLSLPPLLTYTHKPARIQTHVHPYYIGIGRYTYIYRVIRTTWSHERVSWRDLAAIDLRKSLDDDDDDVTRQAVNNSSSPSSFLL